MQSRSSQPACHISQPPAEKGQGLVELAIVIPVLVVIVVGLLDLGRAYFSVIIINNAAREGARYLSNHPDDRRSIPPYSGTDAAALQEADGTIVSLDANDVDVTYCYDPDEPPEDLVKIECESGSPIEVTVTTTFDPVFWPNPFIFSRSARMMVQ